MYLKIEDNSRSGGSNVLDILFTAINHDSWPENQLFVFYNHRQNKY